MMKNALECRLGRHFWLNKKMQQQLNKLKKISSTIRVVILIVMLVGIGWSSFHFIFTAEHREVLDPNLALLWEKSDISKIWLVLISMPVLVLFLIFAWYFQYLLLLFSRGEFFSERVIRSFKIMLWSKVLGVIAPVVQAASFGILTKRVFGEGNAALQFDLFEIFTVIVLFTIFYLLNGAHQIEQENKEFI